MLGKLGEWMSRLFGSRRAASTEQSGDTAEQLATFQEALCHVSPDFQRYARIAGDDAADAALRSVYAALPATGKVSRTAVAREFLLRMAQEAEDEADAQTISGLSDRQLAIVARRAGVAI
jgi:hypothetical protein